MNLQTPRRRSGTYAQIEGQEACQIGSAICFDIKMDWIFRHSANLEFAFARRTFGKKFIYIDGENEWGSRVDANVAPVSIPVGSHPAHAVGYAWGHLRMRENCGITVSYFGDGATSTVIFMKP